MKFNWKWNEWKQVGVDYTDVTEVLAYDELMENLRDMEEEALAIKDKMKVEKHHVLMEVGTGTGSLALALAPWCKSVLALDVSREMLVQAEMKAAALEQENVVFEMAGFLTFEGEEDAFDGVVTQLSLHHLPDMWKGIGLAKLFRCLQPGGVLFIRDVVFPFKKDDYEGYYENVLNSLQENAGQVIAEETALHIREEFSTYDWIMEGLLTRAGFVIEETTYEAPFLATYLCRKPIRSKG